VVIEPGIVRTSAHHIHRTIAILSQWIQVAHLHEKYGDMVGYLAIIMALSASWSMTCESWNNSEESPRPRERGAKLAQVYFVLRTKSNEMFSNRFQTLGCTPGSECCFRDPVLGWGKQEGRGLLHIPYASLRRRHACPPG
jgi:hypothetical protein